MKELRKAWRILNKHDFAFENKQKLRLPGGIPENSLLNRLRRSAGIDILFAEPKK